MQIIGKGLAMSLRIGPAEDAIAVTPSDTNTIGGCRGLWVGGAGNLTLDFPGHTGIVISAVPAGTLLPIAPLRVKSTGTTATLIVALY